MSAAAHRGAARGGLWSRMSLGQKQVIWAWGFLAVPVLFYAVIRFWPTFQAFYLSVTDWTITRPVLSPLFSRPSAPSSSTIAESRS